MATGGDQLYEELFESAPDTVVVADRSGRITLVNRRAGELFGSERAEMVGQSLAELVAERSRPALEEFLETSPVVAVELVGRHQSGTEFPAEVTVARLKELVVLAIRDIGARKRDQHLRRQLSAVEHRGVEERLQYAAGATGPLHDVDGKRPLAARLPFGVADVSEQLERLIVDDQGGGVMAQGFLHQHPRVHAGTVDAALEQPLTGDQPVPGIEKQAEEDLVAFADELGLQVAPDL